MLEPPLLVLEAAAEQMVCVRAHGLNPGVCVRAVSGLAQKEDRRRLTYEPVKERKERG